MTSRLHKRRYGFTLAELMITVAIIGILSAFAYPSYMDFVRKGRRTEAKAALMESMQLFERHYSQVNTYYASGAATPWAGYKRWSGDNNASAKYDINAVDCPNAAAGQCIQLEAKPRANFPDPTCDTLVLRSTGEKLVIIGSGTATTVANCW